MPCCHALTKHAQSWCCVEGLQRHEGGLINIDNIQLWAGFRGGGLADVDNVQLWLVPAKWLGSQEERAAEEERKAERAHAPWIRRDKEKAAEGLA